MTPEERANVAIAYVNAVGWEDGEYGGSDINGAGQHHPAYDRLKEVIADAIRDAVEEEREACAQLVEAARYRDANHVIYDANELVAAIRARSRPPS